MKISIDTNGVLRDTFGKAEQVYQKYMIDDYIKGEDEEELGRGYSVTRPRSNIVTAIA